MDFSKLPRLDGIHGQMLINLSLLGKTFLIDIFNTSALTNILHELTERVVLSRLTHFLDQYNLLPSEQHCFKWGHYMMDQVLYFVQKVRDAQNLKPTNHTVAAFLNLSKAFDNV